MALEEDKQITIVWDERVGGFTSFQRYVPDISSSLNNKYYTFKRGTIWEHNVPDVARNTFYDGREDSIVEVIFNDNPSNIKNFKTVGYEGKGDWDVTITTDQESEIIDEDAIPRVRTISGNIDSSQFVTRQGKHFAYIRGKEEDVTNLSLERISVQGLGQGTVNVDNTGVSFTKVPPYLTIGDELFFFQHFDVNGNTSFNNNLRHVGTVTGIAGNTVTYEFTDLVGAITPSTDDFFLFSKDNVSEASGVIGFYGIVRFSSSDVAMTELFAINTEAIINPQ